MQRKREAEHRAKLQEEQAKALKESHWVVGGGEETTTYAYSSIYWRFLNLIYNIYTIIVLLFLE